MSLRDATAADLDAIMALERASFPTDAWSEAMMREELASPHSRYLVVEDGGRLVGYAGLRAPAGAKEADVQTIALDPSVRRRGRGRALLVALLQEAVDRRVSEVFLEVRADNPVAHALYLSEGFAELGRRPQYYQPDGVDAIIMRLELRGWAAARRASTETPRIADDHATLGAESADSERSGWSSGDAAAAANEAGACT